jgi:hypothetical protein
VQGRILWVTALIHDFEVSLMVLPNADQYIGLLVLFTEVSTKTALSILKWLHLLPSFDTSMVSDAHRPSEHSSTLVLLM